MPTYELCLVMRSTLARPALVEAIRRTAEKVLDSGGMIRSMESLGERQLPQKQNAHDEWHQRGHYFNVTCDLKTDALKPLLEEYRRDRDVLRKAFVAVDAYRDRPDPVCTLQEEMLSPATRPSIQRMIEQGRRPHRFKRFWEPNTGLDYYPFHR